jgi:RNA polymerase sigma factor (sigma-70 family)
MTRISDDRALWLSRHVLPHESALRAWLKRKRVVGLDIDDIVQETYAKLATMDSIAEVRDPKTYAFQIAHSVILRYLRRSRIVSIHSAADVEELELAARGLSLEREWEGRDELQRLAEVIASLPEKCREVFILRRVEGLSQREVAQRLGLAESTVEKHMARGIRLLMDVFGRGGRTPAESSKTSNQRAQMDHGKATNEPGD